MSISIAADLKGAFYFMIPFIVEFNPMEAPKLNEKVLKDKRKKLKETFQRVFRLYVSLIISNFCWFSQGFLPHLGKATSTD